MLFVILTNHYRSREEERHASKPLHLQYYMLVVSNINVFVMQLRQQADCHCISNVKKEHHNNNNYEKYLDQEEEVVTRYQTLKVILL